jgi:3-methyl-2-oxobutanoate hydroxymethyltransferase
LPTEPDAPDERPANLPPPAPKGVEKKVRIAHLHEMKRAGRPIVMLTAYDATMAALADDAGVDMILVGDSAGNVVHGLETTLPVTMDMMVVHTQSVARGAKRAFIVADLPFLSYQASREEALRNAGRLLKESGAAAVKLESSNPLLLDTIESIVQAGIPVMGHLGLTPQSINALSGYRVQGRGEEQAEHLVALAKAQEKAGIFGLVVECVPVELATRLSAELTIPVIGIGAGAGCDGQVLVMHDVLGLNPNPPRFVRKYADVRAASLRAFRKYARDVRHRAFPSDEESYH